MTKRVAIIGAAHRFPSAPTSQRFWQALKTGEDLVTTVAEDRWGLEAYRHPDKQHPGTSYTFAAGSLGDISGFDAVSSASRRVKPPRWTRSSGSCWR